MTASIPVTHRRLPLAALLCANVISQVGNTFSMVAIPWFVLATTGSAGKAGLTGMAAFLPLVLASFFGGVLIDRIGHRRASVIADVASGITVALIPLLYHTIGLAFWQLLLLVFLGALLDTPGMTARQSLVPDLAETAGLSLERVNATYQAIRQTANLLGPPLAGLLIVLLGASNILWLDAATFAVSAGLVLIAVPATMGRPASTVHERSYLADLVEGLRFIRGERVILTLALLNTVANLISAPLFAIVLPVYAMQVFGSPVQLGFMLTAASIGALLGSMLYGIVASRASRRLIYVGSWVGAAVPLWLLVGTPGLGLTLGALAVLGVVEGPINPLMYTLTQERTPPALRARVIGTRIALANLAVPLGMVIVGLLLETLGLQTTLLLLATLQAVVALIVTVLPALRAIEPGSTDAPPPLVSPARSPRAHPAILPDWRWIGLGVLGMLAGMVVIPWLAGQESVARGGPAWVQSIVLIGGVIMFVLGWCAVAAGLRPQQSRRRGAIYGIVAYGLVGLSIMLFVSRPMEEILINGVAPDLPSTGAMLVVILVWPLVIVQLFGMGFRRR